jgi:hypothetical protein
MGRPDDLLLLWGKISSEAHDAFLPHPDAAVHDFRKRTVANSRLNE